MTSLANDLHKHALFTLPIELVVEDMLPRSKVQLPIGNRHHDLAAHDLPFVMSISIVLAGAIVMVTLGRRIERGQFLQPCVVVVMQAGFVVINENRCSNVHRVHEHSDEANARVKNDQDLVAAIEPSLLVTQGRMISLTTPYSPRGYVYNTWKRDWGNNDGATLVWRAPSRLMNPLLSEAFIQRKLEEDPSRNRAEYLAEWREDVEIWLPRSVIEKAVMPGQGDSFPMPGEKYYGFTDMSGGRRDDAALAISFRDEGKVRFAFIKRWRAPFNPYEIIQQQADILKRYRCNRVTGDRYTGGDDLGAWSEPSEDLYERSLTVLRYHEIRRDEALEAYNTYHKSLLAALSAAQKQETTLYLPDRDAALSEFKRLKGALARAQKDFMIAEAAVKDHTPHWMQLREAEKVKTLEVVQSFRDSIAEAAAF